MLNNHEKASDDFYIIRISVRFPRFHEIPGDCNGINFVNKITSGISCVNLTECLFQSLTSLFVLLTIIKLSLYVFISIKLLHTINCDEITESRSQSKEREL